MCQLCVEWEKQRLTAREALSAIGEMINTAKTEEQVDHLFELSDRIMDTEVPFDEQDKDADSLWSDENGQGD
jgi:hypothetical protein